MSSQNIVNTAFGLAALRLNQEFEDLERLSFQIERAELDHEAGLDRARQLLVRFTECGERVGLGVQEMAKALNETKARAEKAAQIVSAKALVIQEKQQDNNVIIEKFQGLSESASQVNAAILELKKNGSYTSEDRKKISNELPVLQTRLEEIIHHAKQVQVEARAANLKSIEKNADAMGQTLEACRKKLGILADI